MTGQSLAPLSAAETEILRIIWQLGQGTVQETLDSLPEDRQITYATVQTLLRRLEKKGYVTHVTRGKAHVFRPAVRREEVVRRTVSAFVDRLFGGDPLPLLLHLAGRADLSAEDIERLRRILNKGGS
jgi:predicted transcriptional regulator